LFESTELDVEGAAKIFDDKKQAAEWDTQMRQAWDRLGVSFSAKGNNKDGCEFEISGSELAPAKCLGKFKPNKEVKSKEEILLTRRVGPLSKYRLSAVMADLLSRDVMLIEGSNPDASKLQTGGGPDSYDVSFGSNGLPSVVLHHPKTGNAIKIEYSDYKPVENHPYPYHIVISETAPDRLLVDFSATTAVRPGLNSAKNKAIVR
jgi:hypothetical protein